MYPLIFHTDCDIHRLFGKLVVSHSDDHLVSDNLDGEAWAD